jgi:site-specific DNA-methyltransferase (adenine-specific)
MKGFLKSNLDRVLNEDALEGIAKIPDGSIDLVLTDPPYCLGKDYGNNSDKLDPEAYLEWSKQWIDVAVPKLKPNGCLSLLSRLVFDDRDFTIVKTG